MGLKTIKEKYKQDRAQYESTIGAFVDQARAINTKLADYRKKMDAVEKASLEFGNHMTEIAKLIESLKPGGVVQLDDVKRLLKVAVQNLREPHPIKDVEILKLKAHPGASDPDWKTFANLAEEVNTKLKEYQGKLDKVRKAQDEIGNLVYALFQETRALKTHGIVQLDEFKKLLILAADNRDPHPVNMTELNDLAKSMEDQIETKMNQMMSEYVKKKMASWPTKELKVGMVFQHKTSKEIVELTSTAQQVSGKPNETFYNVKALKAGGWHLDPKTTKIKHVDLSPAKGWFALSV